MKKIGYFILFVIALTVVIPLVILGGISPGIKIPGIFNRFTSEITSQTEPAKMPDDTKIKVFSVDDNKIIEMDFEEYVKGVIAGEMPVSFDIEALKAQAVAARTFAAADMISFGGSGCTRHVGADVCSDVHCQVWMSKAERFKNWDAKDAESYWAKITKAVEETKGLVITYNGKIAARLKFHSTSGGKTESSINVFGYSEPYLVSVDSPNEEDAPNFKSTVVIKNQEFINRMKELNSKIKISSKSLASQIKILNYTEGGRIKTIKIGDKTFSGVDIRWAMGLKSAEFSIKADSKNVTFNVRGYGHGVGMSQWGANEMAKRGSKFDAILKHYYKGVEIKSINEIFKNKNN